MYRLPDRHMMVPMEVTQDEMGIVLGCIVQELWDAQAQYPTWPMDLGYGDQIVNEEKGEATKALLDVSQNRATIEDVVKEYTQTAAMCIRQIVAVRRFQYIEEQKMEESLARIMERFIPKLAAEIKQQLANDFFASPIAYNAPDGQFYAGFLPPDAGEGFVGFTVPDLVQEIVALRQQVDALRSVAEQIPDAQAELPGEFAPAAAEQQEATVTVPPAPQFVPVFNPSDPVENEVLRAMSVPPPQTEPDIDPDAQSPQEQSPADGSDAGSADDSDDGGL